MLTGGGSEPGSEQSQGSEASGPDVSEALIWKERALEAERELEELREKLGQTESMLEEARGALEGASRQAEIDRHLRGAGALDVETARVMVESLVAGREDGDVAAAVAALRRSKPFLFERGGARGAVAGVAAGGPDPLRLAADEARQSGDRRALLRYLRMRRGAG